MALPLMRLMLSLLRRTRRTRTGLKKGRLNVNRQSSMIIINIEQRRVQKPHRRILNTDLRMNDLIPEVLYMMEGSDLIMEASNEAFGIFAPYDSIRPIILYLGGRTPIKVPSLSYTERGGSSFARF